LLVEPADAPALSPTTDAPDGAPVIRLGHLEIRPSEYQVLAHGRRVNLTVREFELFSALAERPDHVIRRAELYERVWGGVMSPRDRSVDVFVRKLRRKLGLASPGWRYVHTHFGIGYRFTPEQVEPAARPAADA
jgi:DNA-binding response OmpR family regulator